MPKKTPAKKLTTLQINVAIKKKSKNSRNLNLYLSKTIIFNYIIFQIIIYTYIIIFNKHYYLNWLSIKSKRLYLLACFLYKLFSSGEPNFLRCLFVDEPQDIRRSERLASKYNNVSFCFPNFSTSVYEHSFLILSIRLWREIPPDVINSLSIEAFKSKALEFFYELELREA
ncbi:Protein of unknown function [Cotesia congregata]|uniref:Uncharacterized protein n=1 Tax=Cotesia congregata TaxID=51543 RepID=A0A8J2HIL2_COTCN|nr:Protein of unknown function [Cotesia congregata]